MPLVQASAALALGVISLLLAGVLPAILGALAAEHRLSASDMGLTATYEALSMGLSTAAAGLWLPPKRLRLIGAAASLALGAADFASMHAAFGGVMLIRSLAGVP